MFILNMSFFCFYANLRLFLSFWKHVWVNLIQVWRRCCINGFKGNINRSEFRQIATLNMLPTRGFILLAWNFNRPEFNWCFTLSLTERRSFCLSNHLMFLLHSNSIQPCSNYLKKTFKFAFMGKGLCLFSINKESFQFEKKKVHLLQIISTVIPTFIFRLRWFSDTICYQICNR